jgi:hypothetical protein
MPEISDNTFDLLSELLTQHIRTLLTEPSAFSKEDIAAIQVAANELNLNFDELVKALGSELQVRRFHERMAKSE